MKSKMFHAGVTLAILVLAAATSIWAQPWTSIANNTRYLALGDSLSAGYDAKPVTQGFTYQLYQSNVIDNVNNLLFCAAAVPAATSADVLNFQAPQVHLFFEDTGVNYRKVITLTAGGNDALSLLGPTGTIDPSAIPPMLAAYFQNLSAILGTIVGSYPDVRIYVGNLYDPKLPIAGEDQLVAALNQTTAGVVSQFPANVVLVDVYSAFQGKNGLLWIEKKGAGFNVHPTNAGYQAMTSAFADAIGKH